MRKLLLAILLALILVGAPIKNSAATRITLPALLRQDKQEETVYITRTGKKYHRESCRHLSRSKIPMKRKDAIARGYEACKVCRP